MDSFEVTQNMHTPKGFQNMMSTPFVERWKCLSEWKDDALLEFGPFETDELKEGMVFWDLHLSNYSHVCLAALAQGKGQRRIKLWRWRPKGLWCTPWLSIKHWSGRVGLARARLPIPTHHGSNSMGQACVQR